MNAIVLCSGGLDSAVLAADLITQGVHVKLLGVDYGQRNRRELLHVPGIAAHLRVPYTAFDFKEFGRVVRCGLTTQRPVPRASAMQNEMVVPHRNAFLVSVAAAHAKSAGFSGVALGIQRESAISPYYDDTANWAAAMQTVLGPDTRLLTPFAAWSKARIVARGRELCFPFELTYTCFQGNAAPCAKCAACVKRDGALQ